MPSKAAAVLSALLVVAVVVSLAACSEPYDGPRLRVGHANLAGWAIYAGSDEAGADLATAIEAADVDVVGLSEACETQAEAAQAALSTPYRLVFQETVPPDHRLPWSPPPTAGCRYGDALLVREDLDLRDVVARELTSQDGPAGGFDAEEDRYVLCGRIGSETTIAVCTTHVSHLRITPDIRRIQIEEVAEAVADLRQGDEPAVVVGDFNTRSGRSDLAAFSRWNDAARSGVDHVFARDVPSDAQGSLSVGRADHPLIWADIRFGPDAGTAS